MKKLIILAFAAVAAFAQVLQIGQTFPQHLFQNQHEKEIALNSETKEIIIAFTKQNGEVVKEFLQSNKGYLQDNNSVYITDVSSVPSFVMSFFMLPKFQEYEYEIALLKDEDLAQKLPKKEQMLTILKLDDLKIVSIEFKKEL